MNAAALPGGVQYPCDGGLQPLVRVGDHQFDTAQTAAGERAKEFGPERFGLQEQPTAMPRTSRRPSLLTPIAMVTATETMRPLPGGPLHKWRPSQIYGQSPSSGRFRKVSDFFIDLTAQPG